MQGRDPQSAGNRDALARLVENLDGASIRQLSRIAKALDTPIISGVNLEAGLMTPAFRDEFEARLKAHHAMHSKQLDRISLEDAFRAASEATGRSVRGPQGATERFIDEVIDGERVAIKSTAARDVRAASAHISKLCEAAWIQDVRGPAMREKYAKDTIKSYLDEVDRIYQLRVLPSPVDWHYQLVEIPLTLFEPFLTVDRSLFAPDGPRIPVADEIGPCLTVVLDRSDAKVTIANIPISRCLVHGEWSIPKKSGDFGLG